MFWTDGSIQTSYTTTDILIAFGLIIVGAIYYLWRTKRSRQAAGINKGTFRKNFIKISAIPFILVIVVISTDEHKIAQLIYGEENVVKSDYKIESPIDNMVVISKVSGQNIYKWDGTYLRKASGQILVSYKDQRFLTPAGKPLLKWDAPYIKTVSGKNLFIFENNTLSEISGKNLYKFDLNHISKVQSGQNILSINRPYDIPKEVLVFAILHYNKLI
jgi:hypothetical protein